MSGEGNRLVVPDRAGAGIARGSLCAPEGRRPPASFRVDHPAVAEACYFAPFQKYAIDPSLDLWPEAYNQCHPLVVGRLAGLKRGGQFAMARLERGGFMALLALVTGSAMAWLRGDETGLVLEADHWGSAGLDCPDAPLLAWAIAGHPYDAVEQVWREAAQCAAVGARMRRRQEKTYPEVFEYLGWCTWEEFKGEIDAGVLVRTLHELAASNVPVQWVLVDDGHVDAEIEGGNAGGGDAIAGDEVPAGGTARRLRSLGVDRRRFPDGWAPVVDAARRLGFRWLGVWLNFNGYWGGIAKENALGGLNAGLIEVAPGTLQPAPDPAASNAFYDAWIAAQRTAGFDFVKVDNQAKNVTFYIGRVPNAVTAASNNHQALEAAAGRRLRGMINCMAHSNLCLFNTRHSAVTRCSEDYKKGDLWRAKHHLSNSFANMLWMRGAVWGDHDMFHSSDPVAGEVMARSKAVSGGPIYLSDAPAAIDRDLVSKLCLSDGRILRAAEPALPAPESIFLDSYVSERAYRVLAAIDDRSAAVVAYNLTVPEHAVTGEVSAADFDDAMRLLPGAPVGGDGVVAFRWRTREARLLDAGGRWGFAIPRFGDELFWLVRARNGWAVLGRSDKYLGPAAVRVIETTDRLVAFELAECGPVLVWLAAGRPLDRSGSPGEHLGGGLWQFASCARGRCELHRGQ